MTARDAHSEEMDRLLRYLGAYDPLEIDAGTVDRLLDGSMVGDDAPRAYAPVARAFSVLRNSPAAAELSGERQAVARIAAAIAADTVRFQGERTRVRRRSRARHRGRVAALSLAALVGGATLLVGLAAANALPRGAQSVASEVLDVVGVKVPDPGVPSTPGVVTGSPDGSVNGQGSQISNDAHTTGNGGGKGAAVSADASNGKSHAAGHVPPGQVNGTASNGHGYGNGGTHGNSSASTGSNGHGNDGGTQP